MQNKIDDIIKVLKTQIQDHRANRRGKGYPKFPANVREGVASLVTGGMKPSKVAHSVGICPSLVRAWANEARVLSVSVAESLPVQKPAPVVKMIRRDARPYEFGFAAVVGVVVVEVKFSVKKVLS